VCGRYTLTTPSSFLQSRFKFLMEGFGPSERYNIAPTQDVLVISSDEVRRQASMMRWGLIPFWAKDTRFGSRMINARAETILENGVFGQLFPSQRCLIPADSFFEWKREGKNKTPVRIMLKTEEPFAFAGLWSSWKPAGNSSDEIFSCTIITTVANSILDSVHTRMPVILPPEAEDRWLDSGNLSNAELRELLLPYSPEAMKMYEVSSVVNSPRNENRSCIIPI